MSRRTDQERGAWAVLETSICWANQQLFPLPDEFLAAVRPSDMKAAALLVISDAEALRAAQGACCGC